MQIMSFDEEQNVAKGIQRPQQQRASGISGWLVNKGLAANQTSADLTLVLVIGLCSAIAIYFFINNGIPSAPTYEPNSLGAPMAGSAVKLK